MIVTPQQIAKQIYNDYGLNGTAFGDGLRVGDFTANGNNGTSRGFQSGSVAKWKTTLRDFSALNFNISLANYTITSDGKYQVDVPLQSLLNTDLITLECIGDDLSISFANPIINLFQYPYPIQFEFIVSGFDQYKQKMVHAGTSTGVATNSINVAFLRPFKNITSIRLKFPSAPASLISLKPLNYYEIPYTDYGCLSPILNFLVDGSTINTMGLSSSTTGNTYPSMLQIAVNQFQDSAIWLPVPAIGANSSFYIPANWTTPLTARLGLVRPVFCMPQQLTQTPFTTMVMAGISAVYGVGVSPYFPPSIIALGTAPDIAKNPITEKDNRSIIGISQFSGDATNPWSSWRV